MTSPQGPEARTPHDSSTARRASSVPDAPTQALPAGPAGPGWAPTPTVSNPPAPAPAAWTGTASAPAAPPGALPAPSAQARMPGAGAPYGSGSSPSDEPPGLGRGDLGRGDLGRGDTGRAEAPGERSGSGAAAPVSAQDSPGSSRSTSPPASPPTTVLPGGGSSAGARPTPPRPAAARPPRAPERSATARPAGRTRKARLALKRIDPWSVFVFSLIASVFLGIALIVAVAALYAALSALGVLGSVNQLFAEVTGGTSGPLLSAGRIIGGATVLAAINVVLITLLATLGALLYNVCASFTGGVELTLGERDG